MQDLITGNWSYFNNNTRTFPPIIGLSTDRPNYHYLISSTNDYLLQSSGLSLINITSSSISLVNVTVTLPNKTYGLVLGSYMNLFFIVGGPYFYRAGSCTGQSIWNWTINNCSSFSCSDSKCLSCPVNTSTCGVCSA